MMWPALAVLAAITLIGVWQATRWADRRYDMHTESALALTRAMERHPSVRGRCQCRRRLLDTPTVTIETWDDGEPTLHTVRLCTPIREIL